MPRMHFAFAALVVACIAAPVSAAGKPEYLRIVSGGHAVFVQYQDGKMRMAGSVPGLATAKPVAAAAQSADKDVASASFTEVALPFPSQARPAGCTHLGGFFTFLRFTFRPAILLPTIELRIFTATIQLVVRDPKGVDWYYLALANDRTGDAALTAPMVRVPDPGALNMTMVAQVVPTGISIGLEVTAGLTRITTVIRNGKNAVAHVAIRDAKGRLVASRSGELSEFGSDENGRPRLTVPVTTSGGYTITATLVAGPGDPLVARKSVTVR